MGYHGGPSLSGTKFKGQSWLGWQCAVLQKRRLITHNGYCLWSSWPCRGLHTFISWGTGKPQYLISMHKSFSLYYGDNLKYNWNCALFTFISIKVPSSMTSCEVYYERFASKYFADASMCRFRVNERLHNDLKIKYDNLIEQHESLKEFVADNIVEPPNSSSASSSRSRWRKLHTCQECSQTFSAPQNAWCYYIQLVPNPQWNYRGGTRNQTHRRLDDQRPSHWILRHCFTRQKKAHVFPRCQSKWYQCGTRRCNDLVWQQHLIDTAHWYEWRKSESIGRADGKVQETDSAVQGKVKQLHSVWHPSADERIWCFLQQGLQHQQQTEIAPRPGKCKVCKFLGQLLQCSPPVPFWRRTPEFCRSG